ncbi:hypothetical protein GCM10027280_28740 [Micromonospora polyrhachis]
MARAGTIEIRRVRAEAPLAAKCPRIAIGSDAGRTGGPGRDRPVSSLHTASSSLHRSYCAEATEPALGTLGNDLRAP